jgi:hypothetical protein
MTSGPFPALLVIPDISGYTEFISEVEIRHGQHIVAELLELLLATDALGLRLSEVEGDALLLYRRGPPPPLEAVVAQARRWFTAFHRHLARLRTDVFCTCGACQHIGRLSLKMVAHHGELSLHSIGGIPKLMGKDVILAHRLLKNDLETHEYLLVTGGLLGAAGNPVPGDARLTPGAQTYPVFGSVPFAYLPLAPLRAELAELADTPHPEPAAPAPGERSVTGTTLIRADLQRVAWAVTDPDAQARWLPGVQAMHYDRSAPLGAGHSHVCVLDGMRLQLQIAQVQQGAGPLVLTTRIRLPFPLVRGLSRTLSLERHEGVVQVRAAFAWRRQPIVGWMLDWMVARRLRTLLRQGLENLRGWLEGEIDPPHGPG